MVLQVSTQRLFDAIAAERQQHKDAIDAVIAEKLVAVQEALAALESEATAQVEALLEEAIEELGTIVPDAKVNPEPEVPNETIVDEAATELLEEVVAVDSEQPVEEEVAPEEEVPAVEPSTEELIPGSDVTNG